MSYSNLSQMNFDLSFDQKRFLQKVDGACRSIRPYEEKCYLEERLTARHSERQERNGVCVDRTGRWKRPVFDDYNIRNQRRPLRIEREKALDRKRHVCKRLNHLCKGP